MQVRGRSAQDRPLLQAWMRTLNVSLRRQLGIKLGRVAGKVRRVDAEPYAGPVEIHCFFRFERERSTAVKGVGSVLVSHSTDWPTTIGIGDEDTLRRAVLDALTKAGVIADDSLSVGTRNNWKRWCEPGEQAGVLIVVTKAPDLAEVLSRERAVWAW